MRRFAVSVIALVLAVGLTSAEVEISNYPINIGDLLESVPRPVPSHPEFVPETDPEFEPEPVWNEGEAVPPVLISLNPCDSCFEYMTALIDQLTEVAVPQPEVPEVGRPLPVPEVPEVGRPLPVPELPELRPLPLPVEPEVRPLPEPILSEAEAEEALAIQDRPLPTHIIRK